MDIAIITHKSIQKYEADNIRQQSITESLLSYLINDLKPLSTVDSPNIRTLVEQLNPKFQMPSRKYVSQILLVDKYNAIHDSVTEMMETIQELNITLDLWSNRQMKSYIGVPCHYINNWASGSLLLACKQIHGAHTADNILQTL